MLIIGYTFTSLAIIGSALAITFFDNLKLVWLKGFKNSKEWISGEYEDDLD